MRWRTAITAALLTVSLPASAQVRMPALFSDNMVLQASDRTPIYGKAAPREIIHVQIGSKTAIAMADETGYWRAEFRLVPAPKPIDVKVKSERETLIIRNVLIGQVWVCGGQSNMEWSFHDAKLVGNAPKTMPNMSRSDMRLFTVRHSVSKTPQEDVQGKWVLCNDNTVNDFSLLGFFFGVNLADRLQQPVGLIDTSWGGTPAESWTSTRALASSPITASLITSSAPSPLGAGRESGRPKIERKASVLYNGMVAPVLTYGFKGVIWYQGESNVGRANQYKTLFPNLIRDWRAEAGRAFPFLFVQLANFDDHGAPDGTNWAELREAQKFAFQTVQRTAMVASIDLGVPTDIHSPRRDELGRRLAWSAMTTAYDRKTPFLGPTYKAHRVEGNQVRVEFNNRENGLVIKSYGGSGGFEIAGEDRVWHKATARLDRGTLVIANPRVQTPVAIRYAWRNVPDAFLFNSAGLPAVPFRVNDWTSEEDEQTD